LKAIAGKKGVEFEETMEFFFAKYFPVRGEFEKRSSFFKMRKAVCEAVRNARLVVEEEENSIETRMGACKQAKRTIQVIFANHSKEEARRNATGEDVRSHRHELSDCRAPSQLMICCPLPLAPNSKSREETLKARIDL